MLRKLLCLFVLMACAAQAIPPWQSQQGGTGGTVPTSCPANQGLMSPNGSSGALSCRAQTQADEVALQSRTDYGSFNKALTYSEYSSSLTGSNADVASLQTGNIVFGTAGLTSIASIVKTSVATGTVVRFRNATGSPISLVNAYGSAPGTSAALSIPDGVGVSLIDGGHIAFYYDGTVWRMVTVDDTGIPSASVPGYNTVGAILAYFASLISTPGGDANVCVTSPSAGNTKYALCSIPTATVIGNVSGSSAAPVDLTVSQLQQNFMPITTTASATAPAIGSTVSFSVTSSAGSAGLAGNFIQVGSSDVYYVTASTASTITAENVGASGNTAAAGTIASGSVVALKQGLPSITWNNLQSLTSIATGTRAFASDASASGFEVVYSGSLWKPAGGSAPICISGAAVSHTGDTSAFALASCTIKKNMMGPNGRVLVTATWTYTNSSNNKTLQTMFSSTGAACANTVTTTATVRTQFDVTNRNGTASQVANASCTTPFTAIAGSNNTGTTDTTADVSVLIRTQLANSGETVTLESYSVELFVP